METSELALPFAIDFIPVEELAARPVLAGYEVRATALSHRLPSWAYSFTEGEVERRLDPDRLAAGRSRAARPGAACSAARTWCWTTAAGSRRRTCCRRRARRARSSSAATTTARNS
jgi:hypothetical protein